MKEGFRLYMPLTKVQGEAEKALYNFDICANLIDGKQVLQQITVETGGGKAEVYIRLNPNAEEHAEHLTGAEWHTFNAVVSLFAQGKRQFSFTKLLTVENGGKPPAHRTTTKAERDAATRRMNALNSYTIGIDATKQKWKKLKEKEYPTEPILQFKINDGKGVDAIEILAEPLLFTYAKNTQQITYAPIETLEGRERRKDNKMQSYRASIYKIIAIMKNKSKKKKANYNHIGFGRLYDIYTFCTDTEPNKDRRRQARQAAETILKGFIDKGIIIGYHRTINQKGKKIKSYTIEL